MLRPAIFGMVLVMAVGAEAREYDRDTAAARELAALCAQDHGNLWGESLCGPLLVVDRSDRSVWASQADAGGLLTPGAGGWIGTLPTGVTVANTSVEWSGVRWVMVVAPLPESAVDRRVLVGHEAWHRIQARVGLAGAPSDCDHLETERGRYLMRLEFRALAQALRGSGRARWRAVGDALMFRNARFAEFPEAAENERALDRNEGLASYTGVKLGAVRGAFSYAAADLERNDANQALARSFAYASGPAYGLLLDRRDRSWRERVRAAGATDAPADLLANRIRLLPATESNLSAASLRYEGAAVALEEAARAEAQRARIAALRARFLEGPRLVLPLREMRFDFDPYQVTPIADLGSVYGGASIRDQWGELTASEGAFIAADFRSVAVGGPVAGDLSGPGWRLRLNPGFALAAPDREGVVTLEPRDQAR